MEANDEDPGFGFLGGHRFCHLAGLAFPVWLYLFGTNVSPRSAAQSSPPPEECDCPVIDGNSCTGGDLQCGVAYYCSDCTCTDKRGPIVLLSDDFAHQPNREMFDRPLAAAFTRFARGGKGMASKPSEQPYPLFLALCYPETGRPDVPWSLPPRSWVLQPRPGCLFLPLDSKLALFTISFW